VELGQAYRVRPLVDCPTTQSNASAAHWDEIERRVAGASFLVIDHLARGAEQFCKLRLR
jgi:hypothetical protein